MTTAVLFHGGCHGAWCYEALIPALNDAGCAAVAFDLPYADTTRSLAEIGREAAAAVASVPGEVAVVGHSMGGLIAPLAAAEPSVRLLVELCAVLPEPGRSMVEQKDSPGGAPTTLPASIMRLADDGSLTIGPYEDVVEYFYHDCPEEVAAAAWERLSPMSSRMQIEPSPLTAWPDVRTVSIIGTSDRVVSPAWSHTAAARVGAEVHEIDSGHSPFYSRPRELAELLARLL